MEGTRLRAVVALFRDVGTSTTIQDGERSVKVEPGHRIILDLVCLKGLLELYECLLFLGYCFS